MIDKVVRLGAKLEASRSLIAKSVDMPNCSSGIQLTPAARGATRKMRIGAQPRPGRVGEDLQQVFAKSRLPAWRRFEAREEVECQRRVS